jgi:hypothetical protein
MKRKYNEGPKAKEAFERTMVALFRAPKQPLHKIAKAKPKPSQKSERRQGLVCAYLSPVVYEGSASASLPVKTLRLLYPKACSST